MEVINICEMRTKFCEFVLRMSYEGLYSLIVCHIGGMRTT